MLISLLSNKMLFLDKAYLYMAERGRVWVGHILCTRKVLAEYRVTVVSRVCWPQILNKCKSVPDHFLHWLGPVSWFYAKHEISSCVLCPLTKAHLGNRQKVVKDSHMDLLTLHAAYMAFTQNKNSSGGISRVLVSEWSETMENMGNVLGKLSSWHLEHLRYSF